MDETDARQMPEEPPEGLGAIDALLQAVEANPSNVQQFQIVDLLIRQASAMRLAANRAWLQREKRWEDLRKQLAPHVARVIRANKSAGKTMLGTTSVRKQDTDWTVQFSRGDKALARWMVENGLEAAVEYKPDLGLAAKEAIRQHIERGGEVPPGVEVVEPRPVVTTRASTTFDIHLLERQAGAVARQNAQIEDKHDDQ